LELTHFARFGNYAMKPFVSPWALCAVALISVCTIRLGVAAPPATVTAPSTEPAPVKLSCGRVSIEVVPSAGANVDSIRFNGVELLKRPKSPDDLPGFMYGVPVLYPMPNRVRDGVFTFENQKYSFTPNNDGNFLHGLVNNIPWEKVDETGDDAKLDRVVSVLLRCRFDPGNPIFKLFPFRHTLLLRIKVEQRSIRWTYTVDNSKGDKPVPFGFALHPWFLYQGSRAETYVSIPATHLMESEKLLPTGKLLDLAEQPEYDARKPRSLAGFFRDDVYYGMIPSQPAVIDFREPKLKITLAASKEFTNLVLYTPKDQPWFCVENQTCSTDAHNLYARGLKKESHLQIVEPGKTATGWVEFRFESY
jgi:aldose 1-epimerase